MPKVVFSSTTSAVDWNTRLVTGDAVTEITRLKAEDGGPMDIGGATLAAAAMRAGLIDEYVLVTAPGPGGRRHAVLYGPGRLGQPEPGGDPDVSRRRGPDQVRDQALNTRPRFGAGLGPPKDLVAVRGSAYGTRACSSTNWASQMMSARCFAAMTHENAAVPDPLRPLHRHDVGACQLPPTPASSSPSLSR